MAQFYRAQTVRSGNFSQEREVVFQSSQQNLNCIRNWRSGNWRIGPYLASFFDTVQKLRQTGHGNRGFALLIVVVVLLALSLMIGAVMVATRQYTEEASVRLTALRLRAAMDGALITAAYDLTQAAQLVEYGIPKTVLIGAIPVLVTVRPEISKLDINYASEAGMTNLLVVSGVQKERAQTIAKNIIRWRMDQTAAEDTSNDTAVGSRAPRRPFETLPDLVLVQEGGPDLLACLAPDVTVYARSIAVDRSFASERLRRAIWGDVKQPEQHSSYVSIVGGAAGRPDLYEVTMVAEDDDRHLMMRRQVIIRLIGDSHNPMWILADTSPMSTPESTNAACLRLADNGK